MESLTSVLDYLKRTYRPHTILAYGSFTSGTNTAESDFDVLLITDRGETTHDSSVIDGILLDAFVYTTQDYEAKSNPTEFLQAYGGRILLDEQGLAQALLETLADYVATHAVIEASAKQHLRDWCEKMLTRARKADPEGMLRWHWLIYDSLEIYCNLRDQFYFGPKKTMQAIRERSPEAYAKLERALYQLEFSALEDWIACVLAV